MKKIVEVLFLFMALSSLIMTTQGQNNEPFKFKGIAIKGSAAAFCQELEKIGFEKVESNSLDKPTYAGNFLNREAVVLVMSNEDNSIHSVAVMFKPYTDSEWGFLYDKYINTVELYTAKYGEPISSVADKPDYANTNSQIVLALSNGLATYITEYETESGYIQIRILSADVSYKATFTIIYRDKEGLEKAYIKQLDEI